MRRGREVTVPVWVAFKDISGVVKDTAFMDTACLASRDTLTEGDFFPRADSSDVDGT